MILSKEGMCMIEGAERVVLAETVSVLASVLRKLREYHDEETANEMFAQLGVDAVDVVENWDSLVENVADKSMN